MNRINLHDVHGCHVNRINLYVHGCHVSYWYQESIKGGKTSEKSGGRGEGKGAREGKRYDGVWKEEEEEEEDRTGHLPCVHHIVSVVGVRGKGAGE